MIYLPLHHVSGCLRFTALLDCTQSSSLPLPLAFRLWGGILGHTMGVLFHHDI